MSNGYEDMACIEDECFNDVAAERLVAWASDGNPVVELICVEHMNPENINILIAR